MKILYVANVRMPTEKAHGLQIMKTCEAFADLGHEVTLVVPARRNPIKDDPFEYYRVRRTFTVIHAATWDLVDWGVVGFLMQSLTFALSAARMPQLQDAHVIYGRDEFPLAIIARRTRLPIVWETHTGAWNRAARTIVRRAAGIVAISEGLKRFYVEKGIAEQKIIIAPDGVDVEDFADPESKEASRARLGLPLDKKVALYIGRLDGWKGADTLCAVSALLPPEILVAIIGGESAQIEAMRAQYPAVRFLGYRSYRELADNQAAADVLVLPNTGKDRTSTEFTSPLKLFTYMMSGRPIVASDLPSIREVLSEETAYFAKPDDPRSFARAIAHACDDPDAPKKARAARQKAEGYTWQARCRRIADLLQDL